MSEVNTTKTIRDWYLYSFIDMLDFGRPKYISLFSSHLSRTYKEAVEFTKVLRNIYDRHSGVRSPPSFHLDHGDDGSLRLLAPPASPRKRRRRERAGAPQALPGFLLHEPHRDSNSLRTALIARRTDEKPDPGLHGHHQPLHQPARRDAAGDVGAIARFNVENRRSSCAIDSTVRRFRCRFTRIKTDRSRISRAFCGTSCSNC